MVECGTSRAEIIISEIRSYGGVQSKLQTPLTSEMMGSHKKVVMELPEENVVVPPDGYFLSGIDQH